MEITLTKDQLDALSIAAVDQKTTPDEMVQSIVTAFADQMVYKYLLPVADRLVALKAEVEILKIENAALKAQLEPKAVPVVP